eukprot:5073258-Amphidinium_carterae.1
MMRFEDTCGSLASVGLALGNPTSNPSAVNGGIDNLESAEVEVKLIEATVGTPPLQASANLAKNIVGSGNARQVIQSAPRLPQPRPSTSHKQTRIANTAKRTRHWIESIRIWGASIDLGGMLSLPTGIAAFATGPGAILPSVLALVFPLGLLSAYTFYLVGS